MLCGVGPSHFQMQNDGDRYNIVLNFLLSYFCLD